jgi:aconitate decarboxylase
MQARRAFGAHDVEKIVVHGSRVTVDHVGWPYVPQGLTSAQLNLPYCVATLLLEGDVFVDQFSEAMVADPQRRALADRVQVLEDPAITARGRGARHTVRVTVTLRDGARLEETVEAQRGSEHAFASEAEIIDKMTKLASHRIGGEQIARIVDWVMHAEDKHDAVELVQLLATRT